MKPSIALIIFAGLFLQFFSIFGNRSPYPVVLKVMAPDYLLAMDGYRTLRETGYLRPGDVGFDELRYSYMRLDVFYGVPPFPYETIDGVTLTEFRGGYLEDSDQTIDQTIVVADYSNGEERLLNFGTVHNLAVSLKTRKVAAVNLGILLLGWALLYRGLVGQFVPRGDKKGDGAEGVEADVVAVEV